MARNTELSKLRPSLQLGVSFELARECSSCVGHPSVVAMAKSCECGGADRALPLGATPVELVRRSGVVPPLRPWAGANGQRGRGRVRLFALIDEPGLELPTRKDNVDLSGLAFGVVCDLLGDDCPGFQIRTDVANWFAKASSALVAMGFAQAYLEYGERGRLELFNLDRIFDVDPRNDGDRITFSTLPASFAASVPDELRPFVASLVEPFLRNVPGVQNVAIVRIRPRGACGVEPPEGTGDITSCYIANAPDELDGSRRALIFTVDSLFKNAVRISEGKGVAIAAHELYHGAERTANFNRLPVAGGPGQVNADIITWWREGPATAVAIQASYGRFPKYDDVDAGDTPFWRVVRRDIHRNADSADADSGIYLRHPPLWNWGLASGKETIADGIAGLSGRTAQTLPYRAWGFFLGGLRGDLGYLPALLTSFEAELRQGFSNAAAGNALRLALEEYTGKKRDGEEWFFSHLMANAVELTGRSNTREPPGPNRGVVSVAYFDGARNDDGSTNPYLGNGAVNWVLSSEVDVPFLVSPTAADQAPGSVRGIVRRLRPMAAQSIRFFRPGARRWRVDFALVSWPESSCQKAADLRYFVDVAPFQEPDPER